ncbi:hypothetical protein TNCV_1503441 [Trichonephila clavipes]|uniref:Uncharacterized protein n=1 Tax=Trichonephila clavipes TaxID=2585209 RepID=A0A8X6RPU8_TRICX|nr:hypothetical protein TNCV_1503441 [Trichonephila clavipes]
MVNEFPFRSGDQTSHRPIAPTYQWRRTKSGPSEPVLRISFLDESIRNVGERDSSKPFSPTSSGSNTIRF